MPANLNVLDYIVIFLLVLFTIVGARRGFARSAAGTVGILLSLIGAIACAGTLTPQLTNCLKGVISDTLEAQLSAYLPAGSGLVSSEVASVVMNVLQGTVMKTLTFVMAFLLILVVWLYACNYLNVADRFPAAKNFNQLIGAVCGLVKGIVVVLIALYILNRLGVLPGEAMNGSFLLGKLESMF